MLISQNMKTEILKKLTKPIVLVGLMGAGKTSTGKRLSKFLDLPFIDSDTQIEKSAGCSVVDIFAIYGEKEFRRVEEKIIKNIINENTIKVLSTGEGAFIIDEVRKVLKQKAITIWIKADLDLLVKRTSFKDTRPLLLKHNPKEILDKLIKERYPIYEQADIVITTKNEPTAQTLKNIIYNLNEYLQNESI